MDKERVKRQINKVIGSSELIGAICSVTVKDGSRKTIFDHNSDKFLVPASNVKILTTATALRILGGEYQFKTPVYYTGKIENGILKGNLVIEGVGDPTLGSRDFEETHAVKVFAKIREMLRENSIKTIEGRVIIDNGLWDTSFLYSGWSLEDFPYYYGAIPHAFNFLDNSFSIKQNGSEVIVEEVDAIDKGLFQGMLEVIADESIKTPIVTGSPYEEKRTVYINPQLDAKEYVDYRISVGLPYRIFTDSLARYLASQNIEVRNRNLVDKNEERKQIGAITSPMTIEILRNTNFKSNNLFAEAIYQTILAKEKAAAVPFSFNEYWKGIIDNDRFDINDGSGLSRTSFLTGDFVTELLMFMYLNTGDSGSLFDTLPQLGKEGTVKDFCKNEEVKNIVRFKTGSMSKVRAYAGIIGGNEPLSFSIIFNNYQCTNDEIENLAESIFKEFALA